MITLAPQEEVLLLIRRHWFVFIRPTIMFVFLLVVPPILLIISPSYLPILSDPTIASIINFSLAIYVMAILTYAFVLWMAYYLDVWIITNQRIIDVEQAGLFTRSVSEMTMDRIQNVTVEIPGFIATILGFGNIRIQTAGEADFTIMEVGEYEQAKDLVVKYSYAEHPMKPAPSSEPPTATKI
jgi:uncharacterized membrane protein YdbT with pleckstrin-like domain